MPRPYKRNPFATALNQPAARKQVFIGLDFGTTFTKVSYSVSGKPTIQTIDFGNGDQGLFLPSLVWKMKDGTLSLEKPANDEQAEAKTIRYFKYGMVLPGLSDGETSDELRVVSAFFVGCVLARVKIKILEDEKLNPQLVDWFVNLGIPAGTTTPQRNSVDNFHPRVVPQVSDREIHAIFAEVLNVASAFSGTTNAKCGKCILEDLKEYYNHNRSSGNLDHLHCVPELYAEVLLYYQDRNMPPGLYCVVDIGGGTVDIAVFYKAIKQGTTTVECFAHAVAPLGFEKLLETVGGNTTANQVRDEMKNREIPYGVLIHDEMIEDQNGICGKCLTCAVHRFEETCGMYCLNAVNCNRPTIVAALNAKESNLTVFMMGGGKSVPFYGNVLSHICKALADAGFPKKQKSDILDYIRNNSRFAVKDNQRVLVSQMLAQPIELIPELVGSSWTITDNNTVLSRVSSSEATPDQTVDPNFHVRNAEQEDNVPRIHAKCPNGWSCAELAVHPTPQNAVGVNNPPDIGWWFRVPRPTSVVKTRRTSQNLPSIESKKSEKVEYCNCPKCGCNLRKSKLERHLSDHCVVVKAENDAKPATVGGFRKCPNCGCTVKDSKYSNHISKHCVVLHPNKRKKQKKAREGRRESNSLLKSIEMNSLLELLKRKGINLKCGTSRIDRTISKYALGRSVICIRR